MRPLGFRPLAQLLRSLRPSSARAFGTRVPTGGVRWHRPPFERGLCHRHAAGTARPGRSCPHSCIIRMPTSPSPVTGLDFATAADPARRAADPRVHVCGHVPYRSRGADLLNHPCAHGGLDARHGRRIVTRGRWDRPNQLNRERVAREGHCSAFEVREVCESPKPARIGRRGESRPVPVGRARPWQGAPLQSCSDLSPVVRASRGVQVSPAVPHFVPRALEGDEVTTTTWPGIRAGYERHRGKDSPLPLCLPRTQAFASGSRAATGRARSEAR